MANETNTRANAWESFDADLFLNMLRQASKTDFKLPDGTQELCSLLLRASLFRDEGRSPACVCILHPNGHGAGPLTALSEPIPVSEAPARVAKLAFATSQEVSALYFGRRYDQALHLVGIGPIPSLSPDDRTVPERFHLTLHGPGHLTVSNVLATVEYKRGQYRSSDESSDLREYWPEAAIKSLVKMVAKPNRRTKELGVGSSTVAIDEVQWKQHGERFAEIARNRAPFTMRKAGASLLAEARLLGHGAAILVTESTDPVRNVVKTALPFARPVRAAGSAAWSAGLVSHLAHGIHCSLAQGVLGEPVAVLKQLTDAWGTKDLPAWASAAGAARLQAAERTAADTLRALARLTQIDGALICDGLLEPVAAGVVFEVPPWRELDEELRERGTRHQSMWAAAKANPGSLGLVVSQDGDITAFRGDEAPAPLLID